MTSTYTHPVLNPIARDLTDAEVVTTMMATAFYACTAGCLAEHSGLSETPMALEVLALKLARALPRIGGDFRAANEELVREASDVANAMPVALAIRNYGSTADYRAWQAGCI